MVTSPDLFGSIEPPATTVTNDLNTSVKSFEWNTITDYERPDGTKVFKSVVFYKKNCYILYL